MWPLVSGFTLLRILVLVFICIIARDDIFFLMVEYYSVEWMLVLLGRKLRSRETVIQTWPTPVRSCFSTL